MNIVQKESQSGCCKDRTIKHAKVLKLLVLCGILIIICFLLFRAFVGSDYFVTQQEIGNIASENSLLKEEKYNICLTDGCIKAASKILERLDLQVDPCEDFYKFSCGTYLKNLVIPEDESEVTQFSIVQDSIDQNLKVVIEREISSYESAPIVMVKNLYKSCMNVERVEELGIRPLMKVLEEMGGWPVVVGDKWDEDSFSWIKAIDNNKEIGYKIDYLIKLSITPGLLVLKKSVYD